MACESSTTFSLQGKGLKLTTEEDVAVYVKELQEKSLLTRIILSGNTIGVAAAKALSHVLSQKGSLEYVDLSDCFTGRMKEEIPPALNSFSDAFKKQPHLSYLNLSDNALGPHGAEAIASYLEVTSTLKALYMSNNGLGPRGGCIIARALTKSLPEPSSRQEEKNEQENEKGKENNDKLYVRSIGLETLVIGRNRLENEAATEFATTLKAHARTLQHVAFPQNGIRADGIVALCESLQTCEQLRSIDLQDNTFTFDGSRAFSRVMQAWSNIQTINLNDAYLTARGASCLFSSLMKTPLRTLEFLLLQYNGIKEDQLLQLISVLPELPRLTSLHLNGNAFDPSSSVTETLMEMLDRCQKEDVLDSLSDMEYDEESDLGLSDEDERVDGGEEVDLMKKKVQGTFQDISCKEKSLDKEAERKKIFDDLVDSMQATHMDLTKKNEE